MSPRRMPAAVREAVRLLFVDADAQRLEHHPFVELPQLLAPGDLLVVNDAATLPASLAGHTHAGAAVELRLLADTGSSWWAALFGAGDWREDTDLRPPPPAIAIGDRLAFAGGLSAEVIGFDDHSTRAIELRFDRSGAELWAALYAAGAPVQYSHLLEPLELWSVQTVFAGRPWAVEMPSAGRALTLSMLAQLRRSGIEVARLTHAAGLSTTGDRSLDARLPMPERYEIPADTVEAIRRTRAGGGRVIAVGTTVVRALESEAEAILAADRADDRPATTLAGVARLLVTPSHRLRVVDALLTGMHGPGESHYRLLGAVVDRATLDRAWTSALAAGYRSHEFGDLALLIGPSSSRAQALLGS